MSQKKLQWWADDEVAEWLKEDARRKKLDGKYGAYLGVLVGELKALRKKCGDFETDNNGHPVK